MFSSNQVLEISGDLRHRDDLKDALGFALRKDGTYDNFTRPEEPTKCVFQITEGGDYCIGWACHDKAPREGWTEFQFDFDMEIIAKIISNHLQKQKVQGFGGDGTDSSGFLMKNIDYNTPGVKNPFCGIVIFSAFNCYYAK